MGTAAIMNKISRTKAIVACLIAIATFVVFLPSLSNEFLDWDDNVNVYENTYIKSLDAVFFKWAFLDLYAPGADYWRPLSYLSHALDYAIWGLNPVGHHLTNIILHSANTFLVVLLVVRLTEAAKRPSSVQVIGGASNSSPPQQHNFPFITIHNSRSTLIAAAVTGLLFGLHPLHVESVAWVSERKDLLCAFFFLLSIITYTRYVHELNAAAPINSALLFSNKKYLFTLGFFILSLLSKPMAVTLPFVLLVLDWYPFRRMQSIKTLRTIFNEKLPFIVLSLMFSVLTILAQKKAGAIGSMAAVPVSSRVLVAARSLIVYLWKIIAPVNLLPYYPYPNSVSLFSLEYLAGVVSTVVITIALVVMAKKLKLWISVWSYYVITLAPVLGIVQTGPQVMADRYTYLPSLGPFLIIGLIAARLYEKVTALTRGKAISTYGGLFITLVMLVSISYATVMQIGIWKNSIVFWNYVTEKNPSSSFAHNNLGVVYASKGLFDMAIKQYKTALMLNPNYAIAHYHLANSYTSKRQFDMAVEQYKTALLLNPAIAEAHFNLGVIYLNSGYKDMAAREFQLGLISRPDDRRAHQILDSISKH